MTSKNNIQITQERLKELVSYVATTGEFTWLVSRSHGIKGGKAGSKMKSGYMALQVDGVRYFSHRLAWFYVHGVDPDFEIDHINGSRSDNRLCNLRIATRSENMTNLRAAKKDNVSSGLLGAYRNKKTSKWVSQIRVLGKIKHLGCFLTAEAAHDAYLSAKREHHKFCTI